MLASKYQENERVYKQSCDELEKQKEFIEKMQEELKIQLRKAGLLKDEDDLKKKLKSQSEITERYKTMYKNHRQDLEELKATNEKLVDERAENQLSLFKLEEKNKKQGEELIKKEEEIKVIENKLKEALEKNEDLTKAAEGHKKALTELKRMKLLKKGGRGLKSSKMSSKTIK